MNKKEEKKIFNQIKESIADYKETDELLIQELIDWLKISIRAKDELQESVKEGESIKSMWQLLTTIAMASKQMQSLLTKLSITPQERAKIKVLEGDIDLNDLLN